MKILVTGGAGFIGSAVVRRAIADGHAVVTLDALTYAGSLANIASVLSSPRHACSIPTQSNDLTPSTPTTPEPNNSSTRHSAGTAHTNRPDGHSSFGCHPRCPTNRSADPSPTSTRHK